MERLSPEKAPEISTEASEDEVSREGEAFLSEEALAMYNVPGVRPLNTADIKRYKESKEKILEKLPALIRKGLEDERNSFIRQDVAAMIEYVPEEERAELIRKGLEDRDWGVRKAAAAIVEYAPEGEKKSLRNLVLGLIRKGFEDGDWNRRRLAADMIGHAPEEERTVFIHRGLEDVSHDVRESAVAAIKHVPEEERAAFIHKGLKDENPHLRKAAVAIIEYAPEIARANLIRNGLKDKTWFVRNAAADMIEHVPEGEKQSLWEVAEVSLGRKFFSKEEAFPESTPQTNLGKIEKLTMGKRLYRDADAEERFFRRDFPKTDSRTILLDTIPGGFREESLKHRVIIREINTLPYLNWSEAFESHEFWKMKGLDYVPVEPILRARAGKKGKVMVFTRVLGPSVAEWKDKTPLFRSEINHQVDTIKKGLAELGIEHGHEHEDNLCLVFEKNKYGKPDLSRPPRVYVIDFDIARSSGKQVKQKTGNS